MSERIYTTSALVIGERTSGEASKVFTLFTRELGLVYAYARSVREVRSKLRYNLPLYSFTLVSLVAGREYWRIVGAEDSQGKVAPKICQTICRFMGAHELHTDLFDELQAGGSDHLLTLSIFNHLGYIGKKVQSEREGERLIEQAIYVSHL